MTVDEFAELQQRVAARIPSIHDIDQWADAVLAGEPA